MKNLRLSTQTAEFIYETLRAQTVSATARQELFRLAKALDSKESFSVNANEMNEGQRNMICGVIRDVANHTGDSFEDMKSNVKKHFGITKSFTEFSQAESIDLCDKIRSWFNQG